MSLENIYVSWVDVAILLLIGVGVRRGQKRGLSEELLSVVQWFAIIVVAGFGYGFAGQLLISTGFFTPLSSFVTGYIVLALVVMILFSAIRKSVGDKLVESDAFGGGEYYLGMVAGGIRYAAVVLVVLSVLNARHYSQTERRAKARYQQENFGSQIFPTVLDLQNEVFQRSFSGQVANSYLSTVLIAPTPASKKGLNRGSRVKARERDINEILER